MNDLPSDQAARDRFAGHWDRNLAVVANAGSGKTTAISERLANIALAPTGAELLRRTAVVTYTKKAAAQIGQRARSVLMRRLAERGREGPDLLGRLDGVFFGTIHSFCLELAERHGSPLGVHRNPVLVESGDEEETWQQFLETDTMAFDALSAAQLDAFLRLTPLDVIFRLARDLTAEAARGLRSAVPREPGPTPHRPALARFQAVPLPKNQQHAAAQARNRDALAAWAEDFASGGGRLPLRSVQGKAAAAVAAYRDFFAPVKRWLAQAGGALAGELSLRYHAWRRDRGIQTYADQIETALGVLRDPVLLEEIRADQWRVILDEAQDTDPQQFAVLVEITRPPGAPVGSWPRGGGVGPRPGHFCLVGDPQQSIYSDRADIINFRDHVEALSSRDGEGLGFDVTFRAPRQVVDLLNGTLPAAFGPGREHNFGLAAAPGAPPPFLQAKYEPLVAGPRNAAGQVVHLPYTPPPGTSKGSLDRRLAAEVAALADLLRAGGPAAVGARAWGDVCILAPRIAWLPIIRDQLEKAGLKTALQMRRNRAGDNPVYAWLAGLLAVLCDPADTFEWVGVLREVFAVSDALIAQTLRQEHAFGWDDPSRHPAPIAEALAVLRPFITRVDDPGEGLLGFATELVAACGLGARARRLDPEGGLEDELDRLVARAADLGTEGGGPREWRRDLLAALDQFRAAGRPARDALNLMTCHSAKGLEWPVVVPVGLWRAIAFEADQGLRLLAPGRPEARVLFDNDGLAEEDRESIRRAQDRELTRLLYVTLTRAKEVLVLPWAPAAATKKSFALLWGFDPGTLPAVAAVFPPGPVRAAAEELAVAGMALGADAAPGIPAPGLPRRLLPHQLAHAPADLVRTALHESSQDLPGPAKDAVDPLDYGVWWHETLEFVPWTGDDAAVAAHGAAAVGRAAAAGYGERAAADWARLLASEPWQRMREVRWNRLAEVGVFGPLGAGEWIDGVIDLVLHDPANGEVWIVDWKTNRRRPRESDAELLARLYIEYSKQLAAYGGCVHLFFPGRVPRLLLYSTEAGAWQEAPG